MPRGVYDRSKAKSKKSPKLVSVSAESGVERVKRKYTKRAKAVDAPGIPEAQLEQAVQGIEQSQGWTLLNQLRDLAQIKSMGVTQVDGLIKKIVGKLEGNFDAQYAPKAVEVKVEKVAHEKSNGKAEKEVEKVQTALPAPVPFIPQETASS